MKRIRITQIDGKLPSLALMRIAAYHNDQGDETHFHRNVEPDLLEPEYDIVYGSAIFKFSENRIKRFMSAFPDAIIGGTGTGSMLQVEQVIPCEEKYDYSMYPDFTGSLGFTQRGCRLSCKFCLVPSYEGKPRSVNSIYDIWRGEGHVKNIHLLDNDFFGEPLWKERHKEILDGGFKVCFNQGINTRLITDESAEALAQLPYYDDQFKTKRLYSAWDNLKDFKIFMTGVDRLEKAGVNPKNILAYMLVGFAKNETMEDIQWRFDRMRERGIFPYPMVYDRSRQELKDFARWAIRGLFHSCSFAEYRTNVKKYDTRRGDLISDYAEVNMPLYDDIP